MSSVSNAFSWEPIRGIMQAAMIRLYPILLTGDKGLDEYGLISFSRQPVCSNRRPHPPCVGGEIIHSGARPMDVRRRVCIAGPPCRGTLRVYRTLDRQAGRVRPGQLVRRRVESAEPPDPPKPGWTGCCPGYPWARWGWMRGSGCRILSGCTYTRYGVFELFLPVFHIVSASLPFVGTERLMYGLP
jgi:hypothetical protein